VDAQLWVNFLGIMDTERQVKLLMDRDATRDGILSAVNLAALKAKPSDLLLFVYSGHLVDSTDAGGLTSKAIVPVEFRQIEGLGDKSILPLAELAEAMRHSKAGHKLIFLN
jgi:hypothetical protein